MLAILLLSILPLVGLVIAVFCVGSQVSRKVALQSAADASAQAAGVQAARNLNLIAANNTHMATLIAGITVLDSMERFAENSYVQSQAFSERMDQQRDVSLPHDYLYTITDFAIDYLCDELDRESEMLSLMNEYLDGMDLSYYTCWNGPVGRGELWQCLSQLSDINESTSRNWSQLVQASAVSAAAEYNVSGCVFPFEPRSPLENGNWMDFGRNIDELYSRESLVRDGWIPELGFSPSYRYDNDETQELEVHTGPYWAQFGRDYIRRHSRLPTYMNLDNQSSNYSWAIVDDELVELGGLVRGTYGPTTTAVNRVRDYWWNNLRYSLPYSDDSVRGICHILLSLHDAKLKYMFSPQYMATGRNYRVHSPQWNIDYPDVLDLVENQHQRPELTAYARIALSGTEDPENLYNSELIDLAEGEEPPWLSLRHYSGWDSHEGYDGSIVTNRRFPVTVYINRIAGVHDDNISVSGRLIIYQWISLRRPWRRVNDFIWDVEFDRHDFYDALVERVNQWDRAFLNTVIRRMFDLPEDTPDFNLEIELPELSDVMSVVYRDIFLGADFGDNTYVHNPANFSQSEIASLPHPQLLDLYIGPLDIDDAYDRDPDSGIKLNYLSFTAAAWDSDSPALWQDKFASANPYGLNTALSRVEVFNPISFDGWTQQWSSRFVAVAGAWPHLQDIGESSDFLAELQQDVPATRSLSDEQLDIVSQLLGNITRDAEAFEQVIKH